MVFYASIVIVLLVGFLVTLFPDTSAGMANHFLGITIVKFEWLYLLTKSGILIFCIYLAFSKYGKIRLGKNSDRPEFSNLSWFAMLFSAGAGIAMIFWGVAEPLYHYHNPPFGTANTPEAARIAILFTFFHWGFNPWALYTITALALAYFSFRKGRKGLISETFYPLFGESVRGVLGKTIDIGAIVVTAFAVTTALGLGILQINEGLSHIFDVPNNIWVQLLITGIITVFYIVSAVTGLRRGIKKLSNINFALTFVILGVVLLLGPTLYIIRSFNLGVLDYLRNFLTLNLLHTHKDGEWLSNWTLLSWVAWIAWAPFVGMFIARVSKGRTIREFVIAVLLIPSIVTFVWFSVFGGTALNFSATFQGDISAAVQQDVTRTLFVTLKHLPFQSVVVTLTLVLIITFFITSADSATFVLGMFSSNGDLNPGNRVKLAWGTVQSLIAACLLFKGGLQALRTASVISALPFTFIIALMCFSVFKAIREENP